MAHLSPWYTGSATANTFPQDFSPLVMAPPLPGADIALWPILSKMADGTEPTKFEWIEEPRVAITFTIAEDMDTTETGLDITTADVATAGVRAGALVKNVTDRTKKEIMLVSTMADADTATVVRDYGGYVSGSGGGTTGEAHTSGDTFEIIDYLNFEGSSIAAGTYDKFASRNRAPQFNYYSLLDDATVGVSASDLVRNYRGSSPDNWGFQLMGIKDRLEQQFERTVIDSPQKARGASDQGSMGGLRWYATQTTGDQDVTTAEQFDYDVFDAGMEYLYNQGSIDGGADIVCLLPPRGLRVAGKIHESAMRGEYVSETVRGMRCTSLMSSINGDRVPLVPVRNLPSDSFMLVNLSAIRIHFLVGRALAVYTKDIGDNLDDYRRARLLSELTMEFHRPQDNCYYHTGITYSLT
jgi:hypothetical protein